MKSPFQTSLGEGVMKDPLEWKIRGVGVQIKESSVGGGGVWIFSGSTYFKSHGNQYFGSVSKDHGKPSVTIFWFRENPRKPIS